MIPVLICAVLVAVAIAAKTHSRYTWHVDDAKSFFISSTGDVLNPKDLSGKIKPLYRNDKPIGFDVELNNNSSQQITVDWTKSFYLQGGATNGILLDANQSIKAQQEVPTISDLVLGNHSMKRDLVPFRNVEKIEQQPQSNTTVVAPIFVDHDDKNPAPPKKNPKKKPEEMTRVVITDGAEIKKSPFDKINLRDMTEKNSKEDSDPVRFSVKSSRRRVVPTYSVSESIKELGEGEHGVMLTVQSVDGPPLQIVASFALTYKKVSK